MAWTQQAKKNHIILWERILSRIVRNNYRRGGQLGSNKNRESDLPRYNSIGSRPHQKLAPRKPKLEDAVRCGGVHEIDRRRHVHKDLLGRSIYNIPQRIISTIRFAHTHHHPHHRFFLRWESNILAYSSEPNRNNNLGQNS
jgi:hypothetical protein